MSYTFDPEIENPDNYILGIIYYNHNDSRVMVPKRNKYMGWTLNCANKKTYLLFGIIIAIITISGLLL